MCLCALWNFNYNHVHFLAVYSLHTTIRHTTNEKMCVCVSLCLCYLWKKPPMDWGLILKGQNTDREWKSATVSRLSKYPSSPLGKVKSSFFSWFWQSEINPIIAPRWKQTEEKSEEFCCSINIFKPEGQMSQTSLSQQERCGSNYALCKFHMLS